MTRGSVIWVDLSGTAPPEMGRRRPAVVVSGSVHNQILDTLVAVPLSSQAPEIPLLRLRVVTAALRRVSYAVVPGLRQIKRSRILGQAGHLSAEDLARLDHAIRAYLSD
ncbi:MAG: type II toxin-antitoxin system PemK/MazF family toxin [Deltaproteobacteria bacterium]|nr:type II toxin-antitoxin system PemK/MazF family toxin [Deltaproteobacteria bacterium]